MNPIPLHSPPVRPLLLAALALALAACASSRGLNPQGHVLDADSLHSERTWPTPT
jgi:type IV pilus biogenesis protein CpaD/CtpE